MATPPEDDFPTKTTADAIREDRDRTGASKMTVEIEPGGSLRGVVTNIDGKIRSDGDPVVVEPPGCRPSIYNTRLASPEQLEARRIARGQGQGLLELLGPAASRHMANLHVVAQAMIHIGPRAQSLLVKIAERLAHGARQYGGDFDDKPRDWNKEALEEHMDAAVYMAMACMERDEAKAADKARAEAANRGPATAMPPIDMRHYNIAPRDGAAPAPTWPLTTPGEDWEKTRDGCG